MLHQVSCATVNEDPSCSDPKLWQKKTQRGIPLPRTRCHKSLCRMALLRSNRDPLDPTAELEGPTRAMQYHRHRIKTPLGFATNTPSKFHAFISCKSRISNPQFRVYFSQPGFYFANFSYFDTFLHCKFAKVPQIPQHYRTLRAGFIFRKSQISSSQFRAILMLFEEF